MELLEINFSEEYARRVRKAMPRKHVPTALGLVISGVLMFLAIFYVYLFLRQGNLERNRRALQQLRGRASEADGLLQLQERLEREAKVIEAWGRARLEVAPCWLQLARLTPDALYFTRIEVGSEDTQKGARRMIVRGRAVGPSGEGELLRFLGQLKRDAVMTGAFATITLTAVSTEEDEKVFAIECERETSDGGGR